MADHEQIFMILRVMPGRQRQIEDETALTRAIMHLCIRPTASASDLKFRYQKGETVQSP